MSVTFITKLMDSKWGQRKRWISDVLKYFCSEFYYLNDFDNIDCKIYLFILMPSRDNDKMFQFRVQCSICNHECDALLRCMIIMMMQHEDEGSHARPRWCIWHNVIAMMLTEWCIHYDARMMMLVMYARRECIKHDAYPQELMMHGTRALQPFSRD
jgi:hypothetical protein